MAGRNTFTSRSFSQKFLKQQRLICEALSGVKNMFKRNTGNNERQ